jgi:tetratricopeptide (TPR) repeat protein
MAKSETLPASIRNVLGECNRLVAQGLLEAASAILEEFLANNEEHPLVLRGIARIYMLQRKPQDAVELLKRALTLMGNKNELGNSHIIPLVPVEIPCQPKSVHLSDVDLTIIADTESEIRAKREYFCDDVFEGYIANIIKPAQTLQNAHIADRANPEERPLLKLDGAIVKTLPTSIIEHKISSDVPDASCVNHGANLEVEQDFSTLEALPSIDELDIDDDIADNDWIEEFVLEETSTPVEHHYEYAWEEFEPIGVDFDEDVSAADFLNVRSESKLSRFERARQIALQLGSEYEWDELGIRLLTKIFFRYWWGATQRSLRRELAAGLTPIELDLAEQTREVWYQYPEFSEE